MNFQMSSSATIGRGGACNDDDYKDVCLYAVMLIIEIIQRRVAEVARAREQRSPKGQGLLRKEGPPTYAILSRN